jgi:hypothetical protein
LHLRCIGARATAACDAIIATEHESTL